MFLMWGFSIVVLNSITRSVEVKIAVQKITPSMLFYLQNFFKSSVMSSANAREQVYYIKCYLSQNFYKVFLNSRLLAML